MRKTPLSVASIFTRWLAGWQQPVSTLSLITMITLEESFSASEALTMIEFGAREFHLKLRNRREPKCSLIWGNRSNRKLNSPRNKPRRSTNSSLQKSKRKHARRRKTTNAKKRSWSNRWSHQSPFWSSWSSQASMTCLTASTRWVNSTECSLI